MAACDQLFDQRDDMRHMLCGARFVVRARNAQRRGILIHGADEAGRQGIDGLAIFGGGGLAYAAAVDAAFGGGGGGVGALGGGAVGLGAVVE